MNDETLIRMANQIADFFDPYPHEEALAGVVNHLDQFWEPRMQKRLFGLLDAGGEGLSPLALEAAQQLRGMKQSSPDLKQAG